MRSAARFFLIDAFAARPFSGEPLLLLEDEGRRPLSLEAVYGEFGHRRIVALRPPRDPINTARLEFFPEPLGSPPLGALVAAATLVAQRRASDILARESVIVSLEAGESAHRCEVIRNSAGVCYAEFELPSAGAAEAVVDVEQFAAALGFESAELGFDRHRPLILPPLPLLIAPLAERATLARAVLSPEFSLRFGETSSLLAYARAGASEDAAVEVRLFGKGGGQPVTGAVIAAFAAVAAQAERPEDGDHEIFLDVLDDATRRARLTLRLSVSGGALEAVRCGGQAALVASGEFNA